MKLVSQAFMMATILKQSSSILTRSRLLFRQPGRGAAASRLFSSNGVQEDTVAHNRIVETDENIYVSVDMPGCGKEGVNASLTVEQFERKSLCVKGCREDKDDVKNRNYSCNIELPDYIDASNVKAELVNGLLSFTFPKVVKQDGKKWFEEIKVK